MVPWIPPCKPPHHTIIPPRMKIILPGERIDPLTGLVLTDSTVTSIYPVAAGEGGDVQFVPEGVLGEEEGFVAASIEHHDHVADRVITIGVHGVAVRDTAVAGGGVGVDPFAHEGAELAGAVRADLDHPPGRLARLHDAVAVCVATFVNTQQVEPVVLVPLLRGQLARRVVLQPLRQRPVAREAVLVLDVPRQRRVHVLRRLAHLIAWIPLVLPTQGLAPSGAVGLLRGVGEVPVRVVGVLPTLLAARTVRPAPLVTLGQLVETIVLQMSCKLS